MFKLAIILFFYLNCVYCYKQQQSNNDYGQHSSALLPSLPKPKAIIHLPKNVYNHKITDTITLDHNHLSNYLSSINYIPDTIQKHAQLLAQLNPADIKKYGQSIGQNQLPLISLTVPDKNSNSEYSDAQQMKTDEYSSQQQNYAPQQNSGYQQQSGQEYNQSPQQQSYSQPQQQQSYSQPQQQQSYSQPPSQSQEYSAPPLLPMKEKDCDQDKQQGYNQPQSDGNYQQEGGQDYGNNQGNNGGYNGGSNESNDYNNENKSSEEYQQPPMENNYDSGNSYYAENNGGSSYEGRNSYENQQTGDQSYAGNNNQNYDSNSNQGNSYSSENYESSPFDFNFVQDILQHVMAQLEQFQIDPDTLNTYGKVESNDGGNYNSEGNGYESNDNANQGGYEVQGGANGIHLIDKPEGEEVNYGYSVNHGDSYEIQPMNEKSQSNGGYESNGGYASATSDQTASYTSSSNEPAIVLDNKLPINKHKGQSTVTYQMPTINLELPKTQIEHIMKAISSKKGKYSQPIMIKASQFKLPNHLNLGKIKTIAFIKSSKLNTLNDFPGYFNTQLLGSNLNSLNNYKIVSSTSPSKKEEAKPDRNPVLSAYGYGISASASNKKASILRLRSRTKRLGYSSSLQTASSNLKSSIIAALPKLSKSKKLISVSTGSQKTPEKKK